MESKSIEQKPGICGQSQKVPAQRMIDFTQKKSFPDIPKHLMFQE
jgi:hypothetical protein